LNGIGGWLLVYVIALVILLVHGIGLTIAAIIIYAHPTLAGLQSFVPLNLLLFYVITNLILAIYTIVLFVLIFRKKKTAIINNIIFSILSVLFVVVWHFLGEKSNKGTLIDVLPGLIGLCYFLLSKKVKNTFVN
jgi:steroid 5-alpha reductase family enzyme